MVVHIIISGMLYFLQFSSIQILGLCFSLSASDMASDIDQNALNLSDVRIVNCLISHGGRFWQTMKV